MNGLMCINIALEFVTWIDGMWLGLSARPDLIARLDKSSTSIVLNIAEGNGRFTPADHFRFLGIAHAAAVGSAAALDLAIARSFSTAVEIQEGRRMLGRIDSMLSAMGRKVKNA
jgi:four helix bundle protein